MGVEEAVLKNPSSEGYPQDLPSTFSLLGIPSLGSLTGTWLALKAFCGIDFKPSWAPVKGKYF